LLERGDAAVARLDRGGHLAAGLSAREVFHNAFSACLRRATPKSPLPPCASERLAARRLVLGTTAFTQRLIGSSGRAGKRALLETCWTGFAPGYGRWCSGASGMALGEWTTGRRPSEIDLSPAQNPTRAAHARAHFCYEEGDADAARAFLASWLTTYPRNGLLYSHLNWHLALGHIEAGDAAAALRLFREAFAPDVHSGPPRGKLNDAVSFLWRWELAGIRVTPKPGA
jgi:hypothetical protein